jgi:hypothetical protein
MFEQPNAFEELLKKRGVETEFDWEDESERTIRWARLCMPHVDCQNLFFCQPTPHPKRPSL